VKAPLKPLRAPAAPAPAAAARAVTEESVRLTAGRIHLDGDLALPTPARGVVLFAHGSGSSRHSARNRHVARDLQQAGYATLLLDLLTESEEQIDALTGHVRFDIPLLAERVEHAVGWLRKQPETKKLRIGLFGASTGAAAALLAASRHADDVAAVVSRGGRPDLAGNALAEVRAATLLIVGSADTVVLDLNRDALAQLKCTAELKIVEGAGHLFEESGALEQVGALARAWFDRFVGKERE
jgi:putative phosphoribosyl transferase